MRNPKRKSQLRDRESRLNTGRSLSVKYAGCRTSAGCRVWAYYEGGLRELKPRPDLIRHIPEGFDWGSDGSGAAQLALALLAHWSGSERFALRFYQNLKNKLIARLPHADTW